MAVIDTVPTSKVTVPTFLKDKPNGKLDKAWMRCPDERASTAMVWMMFEPVSYAMTAMISAALRSGFAIPAGNDNALDTTGRYRSYEQQVSLFKSRYTTTVLENRPRKWWEGQWWYQLPGTAMAATPETSNHGLGLADDIAEDADENVSTPVTGLDDRSLIWLRDNAANYGFGLETRKERWHWHWIGGDALSQVVVDELYANGISIPDQAQYGFTVPTPTAIPEPPPDPSDEDVMKIYAARNSANAYEIRLGNGIDAVILRSNEFTRFKTRWTTGGFGARKFYHPETEEVLNPAGGMDAIPAYVDDDLDLLVGYPDLERTMRDNG